MLILGIETTGSVMSAAIGNNNVVLDELFGDSDKKHLETLMPCVDRLLVKNNMSISDIDLYAVSIGPGSFTGIRIGAAAVSALSQVSCRPVCPVSTLEALTYNLNENGYVCSIIDSGRNEVYASLFLNGMNIMKQKALNINALLELIPSDVQITFVGNGASVYGEIITGAGKLYRLAESDFNEFRAASVCMAGYDMYLSGKTVTCYDIEPEYMRLSQAERLKNERQR